jgi:AcrR family transcriptional regulator
VGDRAYSSELREEQARSTRGRILDAVIAALARQEDLSVPALAKAAGVSVPTVYRYFPTREALMDATQEAIGERLRRPRWADDPQDYVARIPDRFAWFERNGDLIRAILGSTLGRDLLHAVRRRREKLLEKVVGARVAKRPGARARFAILSVLDDASTWRLLRDQWGLSLDDAASASAWATQTLLTRLQSGGGDK